jgi:hypothetical protein
MERIPDPIAWLRDGVPLTLLIDLLDAAGPDSAAIYRSEPADLTWTIGTRAA